VRLLHDEDALYIGVMSFDSEPDKIIGTEMSRDGALRSEDRVEILLDTYGDQRNGFYFATNPSGALVDGLVFANGQSNMEWDAIWEVRTRRTAQGGERRVPDSLQEPELSVGPEPGLQYFPDGPAQTRGGALVRRAPGDAVLSGIGGRPDHQSGGTLAGGSAFTSVRSPRAAGFTGAPPI
jgi:hypothetical protein